MVKTEDVIIAYDRALIEWQKQQWDIIGGLTDQLRTGKISLGAWSETGSRWDFHSWRKFKLLDHLLRTTAIGGDGYDLWVTRNDAPFTIRGPYRSNLRWMLAEQLQKVVLPQSKSRVRGKFKSNNGEVVNTLRIRVPHK